MVGSHNFIWQLCGVQVELTEKTTQLASHKESNFKLTQGIEEAIAKIQEKNTKVEDLELRIETEARVMNEQVNFTLSLSVIVGVFTLKKLCIIYHMARARSKLGSSKELSGFA